jgi:hypothetical protein
MQPTITRSGSRLNSANDALRKAAGASAGVVAQTLTRLIQAAAAKDADNARLIQDNNAKDATIAAFASRLQREKARRAAPGRLGLYYMKKADSKVKELRKIISELHDEKIELKVWVAAKTGDLNFVNGLLENEKTRCNEAVASSKRYKRNAEALAAEIARRDQAAAL